MADYVECFHDEGHMNHGLLVLPCKDQPESGYPLTLGRIAFIELSWKLLDRRGLAGCGVNMEPSDPGNRTGARLCFQHCSCGNFR